MPTVGDRGSTPTAHLGRLSARCSGNVLISQTRLPAGWRGAGVTCLPGAGQGTSGRGGHGCAGTHHAAPPAAARPSVWPERIRPRAGTCLLSRCAEHVAHVGLAGPACGPGRGPREGRAPAPVGMLGVTAPRPANHRRPADGRPATRCPGVPETVGESRESAFGRWGHHCPITEA